MALTEEQSLRQAIAREEAALTTLEQKQQNSRERLAALRAELRRPSRLLPPRQHNPVLIYPLLPKKRYPCFAICSAAGVMSIHCFG